MDGDFMYILWLDINLLQIIPSYLWAIFCHVFVDWGLCTAVLFHLSPHNTLIQTVNWE